MQPYFLPYLGYFQLVNAVNAFVFFDDVNYIKKGWINKNQLLVNENAYKFTIPLIKPSQNKLINEVYISDFSAWRNDFLKLVEFNYKRAPQFETVLAWLKDFLYKKNYEMISDLAAESIISANTYLGIVKDYLFSGSIDYNKNLSHSGEEKILNICHALAANEYVNPSNGAELYSKNSFKNAGILLYFLKMNETKYKQIKKDHFVPYLSILDVLMFNDILSAKQLLNNFSLTQA